MDLKDYRKKAKELGGNIRVKTWKDPFKGNLYKFVGVVTPVGVNLGNGNVWGKEFMEANRKFFDLQNAMHADADIKAAGYAV